MAIVTNPLILSILEFSRGSDFPIIGVARNGEIIEVNSHLEKILNISKIDLIGKSIMNYLSEPSKKNSQKYSPPHTN